MIMILSLKDGQMAISMEFAATDENQVTAEEVLCMQLWNSYSEWSQAR